MTKKTEPLCLGRAFSVSAFVVLLSLLSASAQPIDSLKKTYDCLNRTNAYRAAAGLAPFKLSEQLCRSAQGHADYLELNDTIGHDQIKSGRGFTGEDPGSRASAAGYQWQMIMEDVSGDTEPVRVVDGLVSSVYHRLPFINHEIQEVGFGFSTKGTVIVFATTRRVPPDPVVILCPGNGMTGVPPAWTAHEHPNPLQDDVRLPVGCPVSISLPWAREGEIQIKNATLFASSGSKIDCLVLSPENDPNKFLKKDIFLIPRKPLADRSTYRAAFELNVNGVAFSRTSYFVTGVRAK